MTLAVLWDLDLTALSCPHGATAVAEQCNAGLCGHLPLELSAVTVVTDNEAPYDMLRSEAVASGCSGGCGAMLFSVFIRCWNTPMSQ